jgi:hypothetical protein
VLVIRQALGRGVFKKYKPHQVETKAVLVAGFEETLQLLLPTPQDIRPKLEKLIDGAIELANSMTTEQSFFKCKLISAGTEFNSRYMYVPEEKQTGLVYMCTFPRFSKMVIWDGKPVSQNLVDASVELDSVFREHQ